MESDIFLITLQNVLPVFFLYTELHYRFPLFFSRYFKKEPEIIIDIPYRINPNKRIPVMLLIKDAHKYPIKLNDINIIINNNTKVYNDTYKLDNFINSYWWYKIFYINCKNLKDHISINVDINYTINKKNKSVINHNINTLNRIPFKVYLAPDELPGNNLVQYGDIHYHSNLTDDMVEFGAPLRPTLEACSVLGLDFICNTDHSYDLDDKYGSWTEPDPELKKWNDSRKKIIKLNKEFNFTPFMIPSEELSMHNSLGRNIHALILNNSEFLPGQGDGAEIPFNFSCEHNSDTLYKKLEENAICIASHPFAPVPILEWLFFKRGVWEDYDILKEKMSGLQILNGALDASFFSGIKEWIYYLLLGYKKFIYAGNDAHGNFNKFRQISLPMISIKESDKQILGVCRTGVFPKKNKNIKSTINALKKGRCFITNGPYLNIRIFSNKNYSIMGDEIIEDNGTIVLHGISNEEFGSIKAFRIIKGIIGNKKEKIIFDKIITEAIFDLNFKFKIKITKKCYFRSEIETTNYRGSCIAMTNPIWMSPNYN